MSMQLVPGGPSHVELWAVAIADHLIRAGQHIHRRFAVVPDAPAADELAIRLEEWLNNMQAFILHGDPVNFSQRQMERAGVCRRKAYDAYMKVLKESGVRIVYPGSGSYWAYPWTRRTLAIAMRRRLISLPYPLDQDAPPLFVGHVADTRLAQHTQLTRVSTVFSESAPRPPKLKG